MADLTREQIVEKLTKNPLSTEQMDAFNKIAEEEKSIHIDITLNEATTLMELLSEAHAVAMVRAVGGYPKEILATIVNSSDELAELIGKSLHQVWQTMTDRVLSTTKVKES